MGTSVSPCRVALRRAALHGLFQLHARSFKHRLAHVQGLTPVHFSAQHKRFLVDREHIYGLFGGCLGDVCGWGRLGCILCQKWHRLSRKVDECKPLPTSSL